MAREAIKLELWENYKSLADSIIDVTTNLPDELQEKAVEDLKKRLPDPTLNSPPKLKNHIVTVRRSRRHILQDAEFPSSTSSIQLHDSLPEVPVPRLEFVENKSEAITTTAINSEPEALDPKKEALTHLTAVLSMEVDESLGVDQSDVIYEVEDKDIETVDDVTVTTINIRPTRAKKKNSRYEGFVTQQASEVPRDNAAENAMGNATENAEGSVEMSERTANNQHPAEDVGTEKKKRGMYKRNYKCPTCEEVMKTRDSLRVHIRKNHQQACKCEVCGRRFNYQHVYDKHVASHYNGQFQKCQFCANFVCGEERMKEHIQAAHSNLDFVDAEEPKSLQSLSSESLQDVAEETPMDAIVNIQENSEVEDESVQSPKQVPGDVNAKNKKERLKRHMQYKCAECGFVFRSKQKLASHMKDKHKDKAMKCVICKRVFYYKSTFDNHMKDHDHGTLKQCDYTAGCMFHYKTEDELCLHIDRIHKGEAPRPHKCEFCSRTFWEGRYLRNHLLTHDKSKKFACKTCGFQTHTLPIMKRHVMGCSDCPKHICELCGTVLASHSSLQDHIKRHLNERSCTCDLCDKSFTNRSQLAMHKRTHRPGEYSCVECHKLFRTRNKLEIHRRIHTGYKPWACLLDICRFKSRTKDNLYKHMERVHKMQHPDKYSRYRPVNRMNRLFDDAPDQPAENVRLLEYVCAFQSCNFTASTQHEVITHQLSTHDLSRTPNTEVTFQVTEIIDSSQMGTTTVNDVIPVPVQEISQQAEAAQTLANLQTSDDKVEVDPDGDVFSDLQVEHPDEESEMQVLSIPDTNTEELVQYVQIENDANVDNYVNLDDQIQYITMDDAVGDGEIRYIQVEDDAHVEYVHMDGQQTVLADPDVEYALQMEGDDTTYVLQSDCVEMVDNLPYSQ